MSRNNKKIKKKIKQSKQNEKKSKTKLKKQMILNKNKMNEFVIVAVYGFLRSTMENNYILGESPEYLGNFTTLPEFTLWDNNSVPYLDDEGSSSVLIEVYKIEKSDFYSLEWHLDLEGDVDSLANTVKLYYSDQLIDTPYGEAVIFTMDRLFINTNTEDFKVVESGDWVDYYDNLILKTSLNNLNK